ncbi:hypothetical protein AB0E27_05675 [Streptomyces sparsogenes]|uniref:hypothetical protein n=1 Tax=Streptomyces sparsogenes TaxID=67365 RepID=UPI003410D56C
MSTPTTSRKRGSSDKTKTATKATARKTAAERKTTGRQKAAATKSTASEKATATPAKAGTKAEKPPVTTSSGDGKRSFTVTIPTAGRMASGLADAALLPVAVARRWLPAKGGLPLYVGLGVLGAVEAIEWPVAVGIGIGYAVLRRGGVMAPPSTGAAQPA